MEEAAEEVEEEVSGAALQSDCRVTTGPVGGAKATPVRQQGR